MKHDKLNIEWKVNLKCPWVEVHLNLHELSFFVKPICDNAGAKTSDRKRKETPKEARYSYKGTNRVYLPSTFVKGNPKNFYRVCTDFDFSMTS